MIKEYGDLHAYWLDPAAHERTCGYWYTVTSGSTAHTAFATRKGLDRWLGERNLKLERFASPIIGSYRSQMHMDWREFEAVHPVVITAVMSNGQYTLALIDEDDKGIRTEHYLNPNVKTRMVFDYAHMRKLMS